MSLLQAVVNLSRVEVAGIDATARYIFPVAAAKIDTALDLSYLQSFKSYLPQPDGTTVVDERAGKSDQPRSTFPRLKGQAGVRYLATDLSAGWKMRYIGTSEDLPKNLVNGGTVASIVYNDFQLGFKLPGSGLNFTLGVDNMFDKQPPPSAANNPINFDMYTYDIRGRYLYAKVASKF